ncbi:polyphosphate polymerase domain-containing protein [uncultured Dubosiella sp.]|uniref:polyphosphate polymerase domain-containing protein n=1 Tax=uncultured Dubosiella sp. TaxID=1937011 RepID=UPI00266F98B7|nr:polyphosphate polymerase domain-containing protein [uncultured Dubosiella sp.]
MNIVSRQEKKYLINLVKSAQLQSYFSHFLTLDSNNAKGAYTVRSLYFDSIDDRDFHEKEEGVELRRKIRLRVYDPDSPYAMLEMKKKQGSDQLKRSLPIPRNDAQRLIEGRYDVLLHYDLPFAKELYAIMSMYLYRPKAIVEYDRIAYCARSNNIRITFDANIRATEFDFDLFSKTLNLYPVFVNDRVVLEVKYDGYLLSPVKLALERCDQSEISVGKYSLSRSVGLRYVYG